MQGFNSQPLLEISRTRINGFCGFSVAWSPFYPDQLAVATSANFGLVGNGKLETLQRSNPKQLQPQTECVGALDPGFMALAPLTEPLVSQIPDPGRSVWRRLE